MCGLSVMLFPRVRTMMRIGDLKSAEHTVKDTAKDTAGATAQDTPGAKKSKL